MFFLDFGFFASGGRGGYKAGERKGTTYGAVVATSEVERESTKKNKRSSDFLIK